MKAGKKGGEDSLGLVIDSESGESCFVYISFQVWKMAKKKTTRQAKASSDEEIKFSPSFCRDFDVYYIYQSKRPDHFDI